MELMPDFAIEIKNLEFRYPGQKNNTLKTIDLKINRGESFGLFGPNGAGKTTLMHCMVGLLPVKNEAVKIFGDPIHTASVKIKREIGFVPQDFAFYDELNVFENLQYFGALAGMRKTEIRTKIETLAVELELSDFIRKQVRLLSGGMKRRLNLAIGVIHEPQILFLDEPTVGVDVHSRRTILAYLSSLNQKGTTLVYTSHQLHEAQELCNHVALLHEGKIMANDTMTDLLIKHKETSLETLFLKLTGKNYVEANV